jgi:hypothetical protein
LKASESTFDIFYPKPEYIDPGTLSPQTQLIPLGKFGNVVEWEESYSLGSVESISRHSVDDFDDLSVTVTWYSESGSFQTTVVKGMLYATVTYSSLTPVFLVPKQMIKDGILKVDGTATTCQGTITGTTFEFFFVNTDTTWKLYSSDEIEFRCEALIDLFRLTGQKRQSDFTLRLAILNNCTSGRSVYCGNWPNDQTEYTTLLDSHYRSVVTGGSVGFAFKENKGIYHFTWYSAF